MKHVCIGIIFAMLLATVFVSCRKGEKGEPGPAGTGSTILPYKSGSITSTIEGFTRLTDSAFSLPVNYKYYKNSGENFNSFIVGEGTSNIYSITRYDSTGNSYIKFDFNLAYYDPNQEIKKTSTSRTTEEMIPGIYDIRITVLTNQKLSASKLFYFSTSQESASPFNISDIYLYQYQEGSNSYIAYDNLVVNDATGELSFDYSIEIAPYDNSTGNLATMTGKVNVTPYDVSYRKGTVE